MTQRRKRSNSEHLHSSESLPRQWVTLPPSARKLASANPLTCGLFPSHVGFFPDARSHQVQRRQGIDSTIFNYCVRGTGWCELDGRRHDVGPGELMVVPRLAPHAYGSSASRPWTLYWFHAMGALVDRVLVELSVTRERPVVRLGRDPRLIALLEELEQELEEDVAWPTLLYASQLVGHVVGRMIHLARRRPGALDARQRVKASVATMKDQLDRPLDIAKLAASAYLSPSHFAAVFRELHGVSPGRYLGQLRVHRAAQLLGTTAEDIRAIARRVGFEDPLYFSRAFHRVHGISPSAYRKLHRRG